MPLVSIELDAALWDRVRQRAEGAGVSPQAYLENILTNHLAETDENALITRKLKQLGYIDAGLDI
jgi:hypothetical protein